MDTLTSVYIVKRIHGILSDIVFSPSFCVVVSNITGELKLVPSRSDIALSEARTSLTAKMVFSAVNNMCLTKKDTFI